MKRLIAVMLSIFLLLCLAGCGQTLRGTDALIEKAREEIPIADAENTQIRYAGLCAKDHLALIWFVSGNDYQAHYYLPMECEIVGQDTYRFVRTYKPMDRGADIAVLQWNGGYAFCINDPQCAAVRITDADGTREECIEKGQYPYIFYNSLIPAEYTFLDCDGNEL